MRLARYVVEKKSVGTAYGLQTAMLNFGTFVFPIIASQIYSAAGDTYLPGTECFYCVLAGSAFLTAILLYVEDSKSGRELNRTHWFDHEEEDICENGEDDSQLPEAGVSRAVDEVEIF